MLCANMHFLNCVSTSINIFIFPLSHKNREEKQLNIQVLIHRLLYRQCQGHRAIPVPDGALETDTRRIGAREGLTFHWVRNESQGRMNLEDSCHGYIKTFCHLKHAVGMGVKNSRLLQQCPNYKFALSMVTSEPVFLFLKRRHWFWSHSVVVRIKSVVYRA